jgi:hypothetical protein
MTTHQPNPAVRESFGQAQQQATAMTGPATPWDAPTPRARRLPPRWVGLATVAIVAGSVVGWMGAGWWSGPSRPVAAPGSDHDSLNPVQRPVGFAPSGSESTSTPVVTTAPPQAVQPSLAVTRQAGVIRIASTNASLADVVRALAQATHTSVRGAEALAAITNPVTLNWQGTDTATAWDALLGRFASIGVSCGSTLCELWIVGVNTPRAAASAAAGTGSIAIGEAATSPLPVARQTAPPSPPSNGDENTETN